MTRRLLLSYLALVLVALAALEIPLGLVYANGERDRFAASAERDAAMLAELAEEEIEEGNLSALPDLARQYAGRTGGRVVVVDRRGLVLADSGAREAGADLSDESDIAAALDNRPTIGTQATPAGEVLSATMPGASGTTVRGALRLTYPMSAVADRVRTIWLALALGGGCVPAAAVLIALALARWVTRPVRALEAATAALADGYEPDPALSKLGPPELRRLAATFTRTATRLRHLLHAQRAFASEASHQLKTPLTALRLRLENFEPYLHPRAHPSLEEAVGEVDRLARMVNGLLALARLEHAATAPEPVDLDAVLADRAAAWAALAAEHHVQITLTGPPAGMVQAITGALEQIVDNLVSNALRVAPPASTITLRREPATATDGMSHVQLHVIDQGPGMTAADRARAFDRFWRAPGTTHHDGTGLGLPIVQQLTHAGGGQITLNPAPGGGLDATVFLRSATSVATPRHRLSRASERSR
ncbi:HAMP domain-containing sensor histidine kinase [Nonomuraea sp. NPDC046802]|uniref:sensor histidine kinase n=1 Tax=Nonomuraea sp. NPDC046802 TaxID=3154919 RepID=UPI0033C19087